MKNNREKFVSILTSLEAQQIYDCEYNAKLTELHGEDSNPRHYNNDLLYKELILVLSDMVPMDEDRADEEISRYIYDLNFGKHSDSDVKDHNDLFNILNAGKLVEDAKADFESKTSPIDIIVSKVLNFQTSRLAGLEKEKEPLCIDKFKEELEEKFNVTFKS